MITNANYSDSTKINIKTHPLKTIITCFVVMLLISVGLQANTTDYDLETFLSLVAANNKDLKLAQKDLDMAKVYKKEAVSTALPKVMVEGSYNRNLKDNFLYIDFPDFESGEMTNQKFKINYKNEYSFQAVVNQTLFSFKVGNALKAARQFKELTDNVYEATQQSIVKYAKKAFYQTLLLKNVWEVSQASEKNAHENFLQMKKKYDHGQISQFYLLQAEVRWQNLIPETTKARRNFELALNSIKNMAGITDQGKIDLIGNFDHIPPMPTMENLDTILERRPDYNALVWEEKLRGTGVKSERANRLPSLYLNLIYHFSSQSDLFKLERQNHSYIIGLNLSFPIFTGGYMQAQVQKARIELEKTRLKIQKQEEAISNEVRNIYLRLEEAHMRMQAAEKTLETAKKAFEIAEVTAANGLATQLELKDARMIYDQSLLNSYAAAYDYLDAFFDWQEAIGVKE